MTQLHFVDKHSRKNNENLLVQAHQLRHEVFKERLGWQVSSKNGFEKDCFDELDVSHILLTDYRQKVIGCWRALPTTSEYMLKDIFPQLLRGEKAPEHSEIWEISRFAITKNISQRESKILKSVTKELINSFFLFASRKNIKTYVLVTTVACERILRLSGVKTRRLGDQQSMRVGIEDSVALWIDVPVTVQIQTKVA
jgi:acyl homoserine lactone synthase